jgi:hypothetical protein
MFLVDSMHLNSKKYRYVPYGQYEFELYSRSVR